MAAITVPNKVFIPHQDVSWLEQDTNDLSLGISPVKPEESPYPKVRAFTYLAINLY